MSLHLNGLRSPDALGMHPDLFRDALKGTVSPSHVGMGMVLGAKLDGEVYAGTAAHKRDANRARNRRARAARRITRKGRR